MAKYVLHGENLNTLFAVDCNADSGIKRVAGKVLCDFNRVTGEKNALTEIAEIESVGENVVFAGIVDESPVLLALEKAGKLDLSDVRGKWEVYKYAVVNGVLVIAGSDKLGAIYGLFGISEAMGISPLVYWADSYVQMQKNVVIDVPETATKEPSVKFRGFFINDEWPCFGNWTFEHFNGFTADMYDHVFELLLRLKGNYLWPAMWASCFGLDGPGPANYELATEYGIYIGNSHHEPCLRAGEEYSKVRGKDSIYGDAWNYHANTEGITRFWRDSMMERGGYTSMVTVGMRGEADSTILGANATLKDNIDLLKDVIVCQKELIKEAEEKYNKTFPQVLALYKEVEPFYYGDAETEGLCEWDVLDDVILMLCEDNHGYLRTVPDDKMRKHPAGFGMYYHVDYHGDPISYEYVNSSPLPAMWEQMSQAYDYGIRSVWILNVGDLKHNEFPLSFFMNMAYDFDKWGTKAPNTTFDYTKEAVKLHFGNALPEEQAEKAAELLTETVRLMGYRRHEQLNPGIYNACHFDEAERMLKRAKALEDECASFEKELPKEMFNAWYSLAGFQIRTDVNLLRMHLYGAINNLYAGQGLKSANDYADLVKATIKRDKELKQEWADFADHKWRGHELASHVGFTKWNEDGARYPLMQYVEPFDRPRLFVSRADDEKIYDKVYGPCMTIDVKDFCFEGHDTVRIKLSNNGIGTVSANVKVPECAWLKADTKEASFEKEHVVTFTCDRSKLSDAEEVVLASVSDKETTVNIRFTARSMAAKGSEKTFLPGPFGYAFLASDYAKESAPAGSSWVHLEDYGVYGSAMKAYPTTEKYTQGKEPSLTYKIYAEEASEYTLQVDFAPTNPLSRENKLCYAVCVNGERVGTYNSVSKEFRAGVTGNREWTEGVLDRRRRCMSNVLLQEGVNEISIVLLDAGLVPMKLYLYKEKPPVSYFGMPVCFRK